jgi:hypothetical protein
MESVILAGCVFASEARSVAYAEKKTLPRVSVGVSQSVRVATIDKVKNGSADDLQTIKSENTARLAHKYQYVIGWVSAEVRTFPSATPL